MALTLDPARMEADTGNGPVPLTRLEYRLLAELTAAGGRPLDRRTLLTAVWGYTHNPASNVVAVCVLRLRAKLGPDVIRTVRGGGYTLPGDDDPPDVVAAG